MSNNTKVTDMLGIDYPIVQGPFGGNFSTVNLTTQVSNLGGLGSFGLNAYDPNEILSINKEIRSATDKPYNLNLWVPYNQAHTTVAVSERIGKAYSPYFKQYGLDMPQRLTHQGDNYKAKLSALLEAAPPVVSFIFGAPDNAVLRQFKTKGIITMAVATSIEEALYLDQTAIDIIICSGTEAGGHRAAFLKNKIKEYTPTPGLVMTALQQINKPIIAAGGIRTNNDVEKYIDMGAGAVQIGSAFLATTASNASEYHREALLSEQSRGTQLTSVFTGREARVIKTPFVQETASSPTLNFPYQSKLLAPLRKKAKAAGNFDLEALWSGVPTSVLKHREVEALFNDLIKPIQKV